MSGTPAPEYYATQSPLTDPGEYADLFTDLPGDIPSLCRVVQGLVIPFDAGHLFGYATPRDRLPELDTRYVEKMLARIIKLDERPLTQPRPPEKRLVGCCRDFAVLFCAMARSQRIPTRTRVGFAPYIAGFGPEFKVDHEIAEYWDSGEHCWRLADPEQSDPLIGMNNIRFDLTDIPRDRFLVAGLVWESCRAGEAEADSFGADPGSHLKGWWFIRNRLIHDLASQNKMELLLWDTWGLMDHPVRPTEAQMALLDRVARLTQAGDEGFVEMRATYENEALLKVPPVVTSCSPVTEPTEVKLAVSHVRCRSLAA